MPRRASQAQAGSSLSKSKDSQRRKRQDDEDDDLEEDSPMTQQRGGGLQKDGDLKKCAGDLVRLALFSEYRRTSLRRDVIVKQIIPNNSRAFPVLLQKAQEILRCTFGMELVELRTRKKDGEGGIEKTQATPATQAPVRTHHDGRGGKVKDKRKDKGKEHARVRRNNDDDDDEEEEEEEDSNEEYEEEEDEDEGGQGGKYKKRFKLPGSKSYIVRSILPVELIEAMSIARPLPALEGIDDQYPDSGALLQWEKGDGSASGHVALLGIRTIILSIILCSGRVIQDDPLHSYLRRFDLLRHTVLPNPSSDVFQQPLTLDKYLDLLVRQNYLEKTKLPGPNGTAEGGTIEWRWGSREAEFSEKAAGEFIARIMMKGETGEDDLDDEEEDSVRRGGRGGRSQSQVQATEEQRLDRKRRRYLEDIGKAAGSALTGSI